MKQIFSLDNKQRKVIPERRETNEGCPAIIPLTYCLQVSSRQQYRKVRSKQSHVSSKWRVKNKMVKETKAAKFFRAKYQRGGSHVDKEPLEIYVGVPLGLLG